MPWHDATVLVLCDVQWHDGSPVAPSPRQVLKAQLEKAAGMGYEAMFGSELEFFLFRETFEEARAKHYRDLTPSSATSSTTTSSPRATTSRSCASRARR